MLRNKYPIMPDDPAFRKLLKKPKIAWITVFWFMAWFGFWLISTTLGYKNIIPVWLSFFVNALCCFALYTVIHDSAHKAISQYYLLNESLGWLSLVVFGPLTMLTLGSFRFIHNEHHIYTNDKNHDPDFWSGSGRCLPLHWISLDLYYLYYYLHHLKQRPQNEKLIFLVKILSLWMIFILLVCHGDGLFAVLLWLLPSRIAIFLFAYVLDYLPHHPYKVTHDENPYQATSNRIGYEKLLTPLMMGHNYHLAHHLFPQMPFYFYRRIWKKGEVFFLKQNPRLVSILGKPLR